MRQVQTVSGRLELSSVKQQLADTRLERSQWLVTTGLEQLLQVTNEINGAYQTTSDPDAIDPLLLAYEACERLRRLIVLQTTLDGDGKVIPRHVIDETGVVHEAVRKGRTPSTNVPNMATALEAVVGGIRDRRTRADAIDLLAARTVRMTRESSYSGINWLYEVIGYVLSWAISERSIDARDRRRLELALGFTRDRLAL